MILDKSVFSRELIIMIIMVRRCQPLPGTADARHQLPLPSPFLPEAAAAAQVAAHRPAHGRHTSQARQQAR